jgi:hypothetical protein
LKENPIGVGADYSKKRSTDKVEQQVSDPMMPIAWTQEPGEGRRRRSSGLLRDDGRATDLESEGLRRLVTGLLGPRTNVRRRPTSLHSILHA